MPTGAASSWSLRRGPTLPSGRLLALMLVFQLATFGQNPLAEAAAAPPGQAAGLLALAATWVACHAAGFAIAWLGLPLLAALYRRFDLRDQARPAAWLAFYGVFAASGLAGGALRTALGQAWAPAMMAGKAPLGQAAHTALLVVIFAAITEAMAAMGERHRRRLAERQALSDDLARSRAAMVATDDAQRRAAAELLHGELQSHLVVAGAYLMGAADSPPAERAAGLRLAEAALAAVRGGTMGRLHERLDAGGDLQATLDELVARFREVRGLDLDADPAARAAARAVPPRVARVAGLLVLEALLNAHRHAGPDARLTIALAARPDGGLDLQVRDDGRGFTAGAGRAGLGMGGLADGLAALGGSWTVDSAPGAGTRVTLRLPAAA